MIPAFLFLQATNSSPNPSKQGDAKLLTHIDHPESHLRPGDYRASSYDHGDRIGVLAVKHRKDAYR
jgi:hypothetical protein